jgi:hypothetical protein
LVEIGNGTNKSREPGSGARKTGRGREVVLGHDPEREDREFWKRGIGRLEFLTEGSQIGKTGESALRGGNILRLAVEAEGVVLGVLGRAGGGGQGAKRTLREGHRERRVGRQVERDIALAPVPVRDQVRRGLDGERMRGIL